MTILMTLSSAPAAAHGDSRQSAPGKTGSIVWQFTRGGNFHFGCLIPGHFEAGMIGNVAVQ